MNYKIMQAPEIRAGKKQRLINEQVAQLTGLRFIGNASSQEAQFQALTYASQQSSAGGSISVGGGKLTGGGISAGRSNIDSNYQSVTQQSGIQAGDGGFQVGVNKNTDSKGGVIASTQVAVDQNRNSFTTGGTLTTSDIQNSAEYKCEAIGISASIGPKNTDTKGNTTYLPGVGVGIGGDKGNAQSTTTAGISGIAGNTAVRTGDAQTGIAPIFDAAKVQREIDAQVQITQAFSKEAPKAVATFAANQIKDLRITLSQTQDAATRASLQAEIDKWSEGGVYRVALHTLSGAFGGGASGALGAAASASAANVMNDFQDSIQKSLESAGLSPDTAKAFAQGVATLTVAGIGAAVGGAQGAATAATVDANNRQLHETERQRIRALAQGNKALERQLTEAACYLIRCAAAKNPDDPSRAALQAQSDAVAQNAGGQYTQALALLQADQARGLFTYSSADQALDQSISLDPRSSSRFQGLSQTEQQQKDYALQACQSAACTAQVQADYQRIASTRAEQTLALDNVLRLSANCQTDTCRRDALAQMQAFNNDLKAQGRGPEDSDRLALRAHMAATYTALGNPGQSLEQFAAALIGAIGSEAGTKGNGHGVGVNTAGKLTTPLSQDVGVTLKNINNGGDNLLSTSVKTNAGDLKILAEVKVNGTQLQLDSFTVYGANGDVTKNSIFKDLLSARSTLIQAAKENGFTEIRIIGERVTNSSSANPGKKIDLIIPVK